VDKTTVYVHSNVKEETITDEISGDTRTEYVYDEIQYTRQEWEQIMADANAQTEDSLCQFDSDIEEIKDALCEIDERLEGGNNDE
jgi:archaellum component FlaC